MRGHLAPTRGGARGLAVSAALLSAQLITTLDTSIVNVALPSIRADLQIAAADLHWVVTAYLVVLGGFLLVCGRLVDRVEPRRLLRAGFAIFLAGSVVGALATVPWVLIAGRGLQGLAAAITTPAALALITSVPAEQGERLRLLGWWSAVGSIGFAGGGVAGGVLVQYLSWRAVMWVNVPVCLIALILLTAIPPRPPGELERGASGVRAVTSSVLVTAAAGSLVFVLASLSERPDHTTFVVATACVLIGVAAFLLDRGSTAPLVPVARLDTRRLLVATATILVFGVVATSGLFVTMTLFLQDGLRLNPLWTGIAFLPIAVVAAVVAPLVEHVRRRLSRRALLLVGFGLIGAGLAWLTQLSRVGDYATGLLPAMILVGVGFVPVLVIATDLGTAAAEPSARGAASGIVNMTSQLAGALGVVVYLALTQSGGHLVAFAVATGLTALAFVLVATLPAVRDALRDR